MKNFLESVKVAIRLISVGFLYLLDEYFFRKVKKVNKKFLKFFKNKTKIDVILLVFLIAMFVTFVHLSISIFKEEWSNLLSNTKYGIESLRFSAFVFASKISSDLFIFILICGLKSFKNIKEKIKDFGLIAWLCCAVSWSIFLLVFLYIFTFGLNNRVLAIGSLYGFVGGMVFTILGLWENFNNKIRKQLIN